MSRKACISSCRHYRPWRTPAPVELPRACTHARTCQHPGGRGGAPHSAHHSHDCPQHVIREQHRLDAGSRGPPSLPAPSPLPLLHPTPSHPLPHSVAQGIYLIIKYTLHTLLMTFATLLACVSTGKYQMEGREERGDNETKRMREEEGKGGRQTGWG